MDEFDLDEDDYYAVDVAREIARRLLSHPTITAIQVIGLGNALYALERMPAITLGASTEFGVEYRHGDDEFEEMKYISVRISDDSFEISTGGGVYNRAVGSDSISGPGWYIEIGGDKSRDLEIHDLEDSVVELLNLGARITVSDDSSIKYESDA